ncbi:phospholipase D-like domain-containing protein [Bacillus dakarensis]|uniref:phospholipase D-like domain-containing protein n=1 Tax=Robertmurraya dakarensis TaxID=1926278 RepID=UPI000980D204|nr:phospholipase D-like domain-containing protein [Bacillus dakarensis]
MNLLTEDLIEVITKSAEKAQKSIFIVSPYIKEQTAHEIIKVMGNKNLDLKLVTLPPGEEYITGATDLEAILALQENGFDIKMLPYLHAKVYMFDDKTLFLGSANFTNKGLGLAKDSNKEILIEKSVTKEEVHTIKSEFWESEEGRSITEYTGLEEQIRNIRDQFSELITDLNKINRAIEEINQRRSPHEELLNRLKDKAVISSYERLKSGFLKHVFKLNDKQIVKITRSKQGQTNQAKEFAVFSYQISKKSADLFRQRKVKALILILEDPDHFVCLPTSFIIDKVLRKSYEGKRKDFQFKIRRNSDQLLLTIKGKGRLREHQIKRYEGVLHFKVLK